MIRQLLSLVRFSHTLFALPFALLAAAMAWAANASNAPPTPFRWLDVAGILTCMVFARSAAMAFNRIVDRNYDALNPRTAERHLPAGQLSLAAVIAFTVVCSMGFVAGTLLFLPGNWLPIAASVPVLLFLLGYSYAKRFTMLSHVWLGAALMLAPLAAWAAVRPAWSWAPLLLGSAVLCWVTGFDVIYACQDCEFDRRMRLRSLPARLGVGPALRVAAAMHALMVILLLLLPLVYSPFGVVYTVGVLCLAGLLAYEHAIVRPDDLSRVNTAFFHVNVLVSLGLLAVGLADLLL
ncbi:MAG: 4-hydroxybenzoate octaprenyltransferase [Patescibacteria group bacterium]|nr:4-hydroxybenzoate octaprenyltransferase [Patescibacteria group bacterium]